MAFANKLGNLIKNATKSTPSMYQSIRCMSSSKVFIGGISYSTDDNSLRDAFTSYGDVIDARVILDRDSGRSRGFGFVTFASAEQASAAISGMDGKDLHGRLIRVNYANDRTTGGFRGGGYGGGYSGGSSGGYGGTGFGSGGFSGGGGGYSGGNDGNFGSNNTGVSSYGNSSVGGGAAYASSDPYESGAMGGGGGYGKDEDLDSTKDDDYEPDDYADKRK